MRTSRSPQLRYFWTQLGRPLLIVAAICAFATTAAFLIPPAWYTTVLLAVAVPLVLGTAIVVVVRLRSQLALFRAVVAQVTAPTAGPTAADREEET